MQEPAVVCPSPHLEALAAELPLVIGQLRRRLRSQGSSGQLTVSQTAVLARLAREGWTSAAELARLEAMRPQSMGALIGALIAKGLIEQRPHPTDRRKIQFGLTSKGIQINTRRRAGRMDWLTAALKDLSIADQEALVASVRIMRRLAERP